MLEMMVSAKRFMQAPHTHREMFFGEIIHHFRFYFIAWSLTCRTTPIRGNTCKKALGQIVKNRNESCVFIQSRQRSSGYLLKFSKKLHELSTPRDAYLESFFQLNLKFLEHDTWLFSSWNISPAIFKENSPFLNKVGNPCPFHLNEHGRSALLDTVLRTL